MRPVQKEEGTHRPLVIMFGEETRGSLLCVGPKDAVWERPHIHTDTGKMRSNAGLGWGVVFTHFLKSTVVMMAKECFRRMFII